MRLTVAICTHNRSKLLARTLESLTRVAVPPGATWEVVVVDNASTDATPATIRRFETSLPLRPVMEPRTGLSHARNAAIDAAGGEYIIWIDDDVIVDRRWMAAYREAFSRWPTASFFGGPIVPLFEGAPPSWLGRAMRHVGAAYAALDLGRDPRVFDEETLPYGANLVIRLADQRRHLYDARLGRKGSTLLAGEEWAVLHALLAEGATGRWVPGAKVHHVIPPGRQTIRYLRRYYRSNGASQALVSSATGERQLFGRPRWAWREAVAQELAYRLRRLYAPPDVWSEHLKRSAFAWGLLRPRRHG
jgi:glucosyl-dolichyl phosphate glucuronosyltransferase